MGEITLRVRRSDPGRVEGRVASYRVPVEPGDTLLAALLAIYENADPTLAFEFGCRSRRCGLCAVSVNGHGLLACATPARDGMLIEPLARLPVVRDLVVDRAQALGRVSQVEAFPPEPPVVPPAPVTWSPPPAQPLLAACNDCLACVSQCPEYENGGPFPGPAAFGKLALLYMDPRDGADRVGIARRGGLDRCLGCPGCKCPNGVPVWRSGVRSLLDAATRPGSMDRPR